jgi:hypothetical protein
MWVIGCLCGAAIVASLCEIRSVVVANRLALITQRLEHVDTLGKNNRPALVFVSKPFDQILDTNVKEFKIAELLLNQPDGNYIVVGKIISGDPTYSPANNVLMARLQFSEIFVSKSGSQIDCFVMCQQLLMANGQGIGLDNSNGRIIATYSGQRRVTLTIWRYMEE